MGVIFVSARIHEGWKDSEGDVISLRPEPMGGHAFAIVGYNDEDEGTNLELTCNWDQEENYEKGTAWGHLADNWYR